jgi:hypothetical protein
MRTCHCTLGGTAACNGCSNNSIENIAPDFTKWIEDQPYTRSVATSTSLHFEPLVVMPVVKKVKMTFRKPTPLEIVSR